MSTGDAPAAGTAQRLTLLEMHDKLTRILEDRVRLYELSHRKGHLAGDALETKRAEVSQIYRTFALLVQHGDEFKALIEAKRAIAERDAEIADLSGHPAVEAVLDEFPGAAVTSIRPLAAGYFNHGDHP